MPTGTIFCDFYLRLPNQKQERKTAKTYNPLESANFKYVLLLKFQIRICILVTMLVVMRKRHKN